MKAIENISFALLMFALTSCGGGEAILTTPTRSWTLSGINVCRSIQVNSSCSMWIEEIEVSTDASGVTNQTGNTRGHVVQANSCNNTTCSNTSSDSTFDAIKISSTDIFQINRNNLGDVWVFAPSKAGSVAKISFYKSGEEIWSGSVTSIAGP